MDGQDQKQKNKYSIIVPTYNERLNIGLIVYLIFKHLRISGQLLRMTTKRWLSIVLDGNSAMSLIWPKIMSEYLDKIVRSFFGNSSQEGSSEVGLIMYNNNSDIGLDVHFINWTKDVDYFLGALRSLSFNGNAANTHIVVEGLAQSLVMFPRNRMTETEYLFGCERHCILVATGDPLPTKIRVSLPMVRGNKFVEGQLHSLEADFLDVAKLFGMQGITLSVIMPKNHPTYIEIFNLGNPRTGISPTIDYGGGEFSVLLSRNFLEAPNAMNTTIDATLPMNFITNNLQEDPFTSNMAIGQQSIQGIQNQFENPLVPVIPHSTRNEIHVPPPNCSQPMSLYDIIMAEANNDEDDIFTLTGDNLEDVLQQLDEPLPLEFPLAQNQTLPFTAQVTERQEPTQVLLMDIAPQNVTQNISPTIDHFTPNIAPTSIAGEGFPQGLTQQANMGAVNPILTSEHYQNPNFSLPQNSLYSFSVEPSGMNNTTTVGMGTIDSSGVGLLQNAITHLSQSSSAPSMQVLPPNSSKSYQQDVPRYHRFEMTGIGPVGAPANLVGANNWIRPEYNQTHLLCHPPSLRDFPNFVEAWQGYLVGRIHSPYRESFYFAKALKKPTSSVIPRAEWPSRLEIIIFIPKNAVLHTLRICVAPIDYMFFHMIQCDNLDLYNHMMTKSLCAKIELPYQTLILATTESEQHLLGIIFPKDAVFVEPN